MIWLIIWLLGCFFSIGVRFSGEGPFIFILAPFWPIELFCWTIVESYGLLEQYFTTDPREE